MNIIGALTKRVLPERAHGAVAGVFHTTGSTNLDAVMRFYEADDGLQPHYCLACDGTIYRIAWENQIAWHCKIEHDEATLYAQGYQTWSGHRWGKSGPIYVGGEFTGYVSWRKFWRELKGLQSPLELVTGAHPNNVSIGIELQQPEKPGPDIFTDAQYASATELVRDISSRNGIPIRRDHWLGHYDCSPMRRSTAAGGWDPGERFKFDRIFDAIR